VTELKQYRYGSVTLRTRDLCYSSHTFRRGRYGIAKGIQTQSFLLDLSLSDKP